jgi:hypothetical protein
MRAAVRKKKVRMCTKERKKRLKLMIFLIFRYFLALLFCSLICGPHLFIFIEEKLPSLCVIEANCNRLHTCIDGTCLRYFPAKPANKTKCHSRCLKDLKLYEEKYYRQEIGNIIFFDTDIFDHCLLGYKQTNGLRSSYDNDFYSKLHFENIKNRELLKSWIIALCVFT